MRQENIVSVAHGSATIMDWRALRKLADFDGFHLHLNEVR